MTTNQKKNLTPTYASVQAGFWMGFVVYGAFSSYYLLEAGLSNTSIGIILSISALISAILSPFVGAMIDRSPSIKNREVIAILSIAVAGFSVVLYFVPLSSAWGSGFMFAIIYCVSQLLCPFINALGAEYINAGYELNFGTGRAGGSFGYAIFATVMGSLTVKYGTVCIPMVSFVMFLLLAWIALYRLPKLGSSRQSLMKSQGKQPDASLSKEARAESNQGDSPIAFMKKYPVYMIFLGGLILIYFAHNYVNVYALQIIQLKGGNSQHMGISASIGAVVETLPMLTYNRFLSKRFTMKGLIRFSAIFFIVKELLTLVVPTTNLYYLVMLTQAFAWGVIAVTIVYYVNDIIDLENASQGQAYAGMALTLGTVLCSFFCGILMDVIGVNATTGVSTVICAIGTIIVWITTGILAKQ